MVDKVLYFPVQKSKIKIFVVKLAWKLPTVCKQVTTELEDLFVFTTCCNKQNDNGASSKVNP